MKKKQIKLVLFDLDGVLINSKSNMHSSWTAVKKKFNINVHFNKYFKCIGLPFNDILNHLNIDKKLFKKISKTYSKTSITEIKKIKLYPNVKETINKLVANKIKVAIVTSKEKKRSIRIIKSLGLKINTVVSPNSKLRGKPKPDQILKAIKQFKSKKQNTVYIGDMKVDYYSAKNAKIDFIFAKYGYGKISKLYKYSINDISKILQMV